MASSIGPGNTGYQINQDFKSRSTSSDSSEMTNLRNQSGTTATQAKHHKSGGVKKKGGDEEMPSNALQLSKDAQAALEKSDLDASVEKEGTETAHKTGIKTGGEEDYEQNIEAGERNAEAEELPAGYAQVESPTGEKQILDPEKVETLSALDHNESPDHLNSDIPDKSFDAASQVLDGQIEKAKGSLKPLAVTKPAPAEIAQAVGTPELQIVPVQSEPLDIRDPGNDPKNGPLQIAPDAHEESMAQDAAMKQVQDGGQEALLADGTAVAGAAAGGKKVADDAPLTAQEKAQLEGQVSQDRGFVDGTMKALRASLPPEMQSQLDQSTQSLAAAAKDQASKNGEKLDDASAHYRGIAFGAHQSLTQLATDNPDVAALLKKNTNAAGEWDLAALGAGLSGLAGGQQDAMMKYRLNMGAVSTNLLDKVQSMETNKEVLTTNTHAAKQGMLEKRTDAAWNKITNEGTWQTAGMTAGDRDGIKQRAADQAKIMARGNVGAPAYGEFVHISMADQISKWASDRADEEAKEAKDDQDKAARMKALQELQQGGDSYVNDRSDWMMS